MTIETMPNSFDAIVVGGSYAGLFDPTVET